MKLLVVDDHPLILEALAQYVAEAEPAWTLLTALSRDDALRVLALHADCDAMLLDLALPGTRGLAFLAELRREYLPGGAIAVVVPPTSRSLWAT